MELIGSDWFVICSAANQYLNVNEFWLIASVLILETIPWEFTVSDLKYVCGPFY